MRSSAKLVCKPIAAAASSRAAAEPMYDQTSGPSTKVTAPRAPFATSVCLPTHMLMIQPFRPSTLSRSVTGLFCSQTHVSLSHNSTCHIHKGRVPQLQVQPAGMLLPHQTTLQATCLHAGHQPNRWGLHTSHHVPLYTETISHLCHTMTPTACGKPLVHSKTSVINTSRCTNRCIAYLGPRVPSQPVQPMMVQPAQHATDGQCRTHSHHKHKTLSLPG